MKITKIEAIPFTVPYRTPMRFASDEVTVADHVLVHVHTDDGLVGVAEAPPRPYTYGETQASLVAIIREVFAPALVGTDPGSPPSAKCARRTSARPDRSAMRRDDA